MPNFLEVGIAEERAMRAARGASHARRRKWRDRAIKIVGQCAATTLGLDSLHAACEAAKAADQEFSHIAGAALEFWRVMHRYCQPMKLPCSQKVDKDQREMFDKPNEAAHV